MIRFLHAVARPFFSPPAGLVACALAGWTCLGAAARAQTPVVAVDCGGSGTSAGGTAFQADQPYASGGWGHVGGAEVLTSETRLGPIDHPYEEVCRRARVGFDAYRFDVPNGDYLVRLHLCEIVAHGRGLRRFDVELEGAVVLDDVDVAARYGHDYAGVFTAAVTVADGRLDVEFAPTIGQSLLNGIEVQSLDAPLSAPAAPSGIVADWSYGANVVHWDVDDAPGLAGWRVEAASSASGPFTPLATQWSQPARTIDLGAPVGAERFYRVVPIGVVTPGVFVDGPASEVVSATARSSSQSKLPVYELSVEPAQLAQLNSLFISDADFEIPATLSFQGTDYAATLRYSGFTSGDDPKKSFKLRFGQGQTFQDRRELNLKSHFSDDSMARQELSRRMFLAAGHAAPRATWVHVTLNGEFAGVYEDLELIEEDFLRHRELPDGPIYQAYLNFSASLFPIDPATNVPYEVAYKKKTEQDQPYTDLIQFIDELDSTPDADFRAWIATRLDVDDFLDFWAATCVVADLEKVLRDYHLYRDGTTGRWSIWAWDTDASWKQNFLPYNFGSIPFWVGEHQLAVRILADPVWAYAYRRKVQTLLDGAASPETGGSFESLWSDQFDLFGEDALADYNKYGWENDQPFVASYDQILSQVGVRHDAIEGQFASEAAPKVPHAVWLNEFQAANVSTVADPAGQFDDWVELVNVTDTPFDLSGYHLTDDPANLTRYTFPSGTTIPANGHLLVWCDGDLAQPGLHANFGLSADGEVIALSTPGGTELLDVIHFGPQRDDLSFGRSGGAAPGPVWALNADPTPGAANQAPDNLPPWMRLVEHAPGAPAPDTAVVFSAHVDDANLASVELRWRVGGGAFQVAAMTDLGGGYFEHSLPGFGAGAQVEYWLRAVDEDGDETRYPQAAPNALASFSVVAVVTGDLRINEVCADNDTLATDPQGQYEDFVEIYNAGTVAIDLDDYWLTDDLTDPNAYSLPAGVVLAPGERVVVWCDGDVADGALHAPFGLSKDGEEIGLFREDAGGMTLIDGFAFGPMPSDTSVGPLLDGRKKRLRLLDPSPGAPNEPAPGGFVRYDTPDGAGALVELGLSGSLDLGGFFQFVAVGTPHAPSLLGIGFAPAALPLGPNAPQLIDTVGALIFTATAGANGVVAYPLAVPPLPAFTGLSAYAQGIVGTQFTEGVHLVIGN